MKLHSFIIMERSGHPLQEFLNEKKQKFSVKVACEVGISIINCFEKLHNIGKVYNNLNLENVLIQKYDQDTAPRVTLINLDNCTDYLMSDGDGNNRHIPRGTEDTFRGNLMMASLNDMNYKKLSRRDDLISLSYLLIYMI